MTGANNFGFDTVWVNRNDTLFDQNGDDPTITVNHLNELVKWLELNN
ncbi:MULTISPECIES: hypothetical protein [Staphylococcus]